MFQVAFWCLQTFSMLKLNPRYVNTVNVLLLIVRTVQWFMAKHPFPKKHMIEVC